ncbi:MAG: LacI family DNA-binding transcriptional regulator [Eubacteriales bacterium]
MGATLKDIAKETGLSVATISKYINGATLKEPNRIAVEAAINKLGYTVNEYARGLKSNRSRTIGIAIPELANLFISNIITHVEDELRNQGYSAVICDCHSQEQLECDNIAFLNRKMVDGIINMPVCQDGHHLQPAIERGVPIVLVDRGIPHLLDVTNSVLLDNQQAAYDATIHLLERGHRTIGIILGAGNVYTTQTRFAGYKKALEEYNVPLNENLVAYSDYTVQEGHSCLNALIMANPTTDAVFVTNYETTLGALIAINERGMKIPEELSLIGFDNLDLCRVSNPKLTIMAQPLEEMGRSIAQIMLSHLEQKEAQPAVHITLPARMQAGESVSTCNP